MKSIVHKASERGIAEHGWLKATHSFSFGNYYNSEKMNFGKLRVLNDDSIAPSKGFNLHPHHDMEIITIPLLGSLRHGDNMGNEEIISAGEVQVMSAGTGVWHSEFNASDAVFVNLFQLWIFPDKKGHTPRYEQKFFSEEKRRNKWQILVSPDGTNNSLWIHQNAFISMIDTKDIKSIEYQLNSAENGVYFMLVDGSVDVGGYKLQKRDAIGLWSIKKPFFFSIKENSKILAIEVPMN